MEKQKIIDALAEFKKAAHKLNIQWDEYDRENGGSTLAVNYPAGMDSFDDVVMQITSWVDLSINELKSSK